MPYYVTVYRYNSYVLNQLIWNKWAYDVVYLKVWGRRRVAHDEMIMSRLARITHGSKHDIDLTWHAVFD